MDTVPTDRLEIEGESTTMPTQATQDHPIRIPLGVLDTNEVAYMNMTENWNWAISGATEDSTALLRELATYLTAQYSPDEVQLLFADFDHYSVGREFTDHPHVVGVRDGIADDRMAQHEAREHGDQIFHRLREHLATRTATSSEAELFIFISGAHHLRKRTWLHGEIEELGVLSRANATHLILTGRSCFADLHLNRIMANFTGRMTLQPISMLEASDTTPAQQPKRYGTALMHDSALSSGSTVHLLAADSQSDSRHDRDSSLLPPRQSTLPGANENLRALLQPSTLISSIA